MEMPAKTETKTATAAAAARAKRTKRRTRTRARARAQALFKTTATGNGNSYTRNINTVENYTELEKILYFQQNSAAKQHNKTKIKSKRNHLKFLINLYFKLILYINHIKKLFKLKYSHTNENSQNCIINLEKEKTVCLKTISLQIVRRILISFHNCRRKNLINYVQLAIRHFVGICHKRLISFKRLQQQIPESSKYVQPIKARNHKTEEFVTIKVNYKVLLKWPEDGLEEAVIYKKLKHLLELEHEAIFEQNLADFDIQNFNVAEACGQLKLQAALHVAFKHENEEKSKRTVFSEIKTSLYHSNLQLYTLSRSFRLKCSHLYVRKLNCQLDTFYNGISISDMILKVQNNNCSNKRSFTKVLSNLYADLNKNLESSPQQHNHKRKPQENWCCQSRKYCKAVKCYCRKIFEVRIALNWPYSKDDYKCLQSYRDFAIQIGPKCCQLVAIELSCFPHNIQAQKHEWQNSETSSKPKYMDKQQYSSNSRQQQNREIHFTEIFVLRVLPYAEKRKQEFALSSISKFGQCTGLTAVLSQTVGNKYEINTKFGPTYTKTILKIREERIFTEFSSNSALKGCHITINTIVFKYDPEKYQQFEIYIANEYNESWQVFNKFSTNSAQMCDHPGNIIQLLEIFSNAKQQHFTKCCCEQLIYFSTKSTHKCCQLKICIQIKIESYNIIIIKSSVTFQETYSNIEFTAQSARQCCQVGKQKNSSPPRTFRKYKVKHFPNKSILNKNKVGSLPMKKYFNLRKNNATLKITKQNVQKLAEIKSNLPQRKRTYFTMSWQKPGHFMKNNQIADLKHFNTLLAEQHGNKTIFIITDKPSTFHQNQQPNFNQELRIENGLQKPTALYFINGEVEAAKLKLALKANIVRHFQSVDNNNSYQVKCKHREFLKKCQHILFTILLSCCCCCFCYWHINGYPLVLVKIFKYLKDATVHVLTRRLKAEIVTTTAKKATAANCYYCGNNETACNGKFKKSTEMPDYEANNQENVFKRQQAHITATTTPTITTSRSSSAWCSTKSLTAPSSYCKSLKNLISLKKTTQKQFQAQDQQQQQQGSPYYRYQQHHHDYASHHNQHHHQHHHHHHHHYQHNRQAKGEQAQQQQQQRHKQQFYNCNSTIHLQLPSLLVFSRTLIILILLSSLWHTSEGFHGSSVKLSTNTVKTKYGLVRGIVVRSSPSLVEAYLGIPYASPPVGSLRFMPPITPSTWKTVRNADRFSPVCPQNVPIPPNGPEALLEVPRARLAQLRRLLPLLSNQSEDCLYLNIYVPSENRRHRRFTELKEAPKLPTVLFIHGESYEWNSGNPYDGSELAAHGNVIVVTINFRLGILGFLKTGGKESAQGNFGLMDLVAGLHWLKENLPAFGGDPQQITLLGHGTGAALANILVVSPVASDLIEHAVMVSGSALAPWAIQKNPLFVKRRVAEQTGCHGDMLYYDLAPCLRTKAVKELLAVKIDHPRFLVGFAPFVDGTVISPNTNSIGKLSLPLGSAIVSTSGIEFANFPKRNLMFCLTSVESHLDLNAQDLEFGFNETRRDRILRTYVRNNFHYHLNEIFAVLKNEYTDWDQAIRSPLSSRDATLQFLSDGHTASSLIKLGYMHSLRGGKGYFLHFKHRTIEEEYPQRTGSVRGEDVPFWLGLPISPLFPHNYTAQEKQISRLMLRYLANFAKTGNPNQSSLPLSQPSAFSLISSVSPLATSTSSSSTANEALEKIKRSSFNMVNATSLNSSGPNKSHHIVEDVATAAARQALNLAVLYNQRRTKRTYYKRHSRSNDDHSASASSEVNYFLSSSNNNNNNDNSFNKFDSSVLPFWDAYDVVNQLYMELGNKAEIQSHYRGHKLSMWLNLIPQLHRHANMNDQSMRHHQFQDDLNNLNLYEGIVRAQLQTKPDDDDETLLLPRSRPTSPPTVQETNATQRPQGGTTECGVDGAMFVAEMTTVPPPSENRSLVLDSREKEMATASTGIMGNLEVLRRLSGKQFPSYATALIATVAVGCFLFILNILIFAGIYHQREKRAKDAKTKEELQDNDTSKNSSMLKLNALGSESGSFNGSGAGVSGKTTVVFGEYSCYDEKSLQTKDEKLIVKLPPKQMVEANWAACSTSTLDLLKTKHHTPLDNNYALGNLVPIATETQTEHLMVGNNLEMATYNPLPLATGLIIDPSFAAASSTGLLSKRSSFVGSAGQLNQYDFASVQSSDQMSFKDIENAVKASATMNDDITQDDDIPEPPPPPRSFQTMQQQQAAATTATAATCGTGGGGILRQAGTTSASQTGGGKKRVHIQEISV